MTFKWALAIALVAAAVLPASAGAQLQINPPQGDNYLGPIFMNDETTPFPKTEVGFKADTTNYTVQSDLFAPPGSGGPPEPTQCGEANTIWSVFFSNRYGIMNVSVAGAFDSAIAVIPFNSPNDPAPNLAAGFCQDRLAGLQEDTSFFVSPKHWYAVQVGGVGNPKGGLMQAKFLLANPPTVSGQAFLFWHTQPLRVTTMYVKGVPKGETLTLSCTKGACKKKTINVKSKQAAGVFGAGIASAPIGVRMKGAAGWSDAAPADAALRQLVHEAKARVQILANQKVKRGAKIVLRISRPGYIGRYFVWSVAGSSISSAKTLCMNPGSTAPRKACHG